MSTFRSPLVRRTSEAATPDTPAAKSRPSAPTLSGGQHLDAGTNAAMSARFGHDFSQVRIHDGAGAGAATDALGAQAVTLGSDIAFAQGAYSPGDAGGEKLLAHELTHVVQQDRFGLGAESVKSRRSDPSEREAERAADQAVSGGPVSISAAPRAAFSCFDPGYNDVKDDFWNTKSALGKQDGSTLDSGINTFWDVAGLSGAGGLASTGIDLGKSLYSEGMSTLHGWEADLTGDNGERMRSKQYDEAASSFLGDAGVDAVGMIPVVGTGQGVHAAAWDGLRTAGLAGGANPDASPSFGDLQKLGAQKAVDAVTPDTPAPDPNQAPDPNTPPVNTPDDPFQGLQ